MKEGDNKRTTLLVNVGEDLGTHTVLCKRLESTGGSKCARVGDRHDRDQDDGVKNRWEDLDTGELDGDDEWRVTTGGSFSLVKRRVGWDDQSNEEEVDDVEDTDTPDDLFGSLGHFLAWVLSLGSGKTSQFSATERERCSDKNCAETVKAVEEARPWCVPRRC